MIEFWPENDPTALTRTRSVREFVDCHPLVFENPTSDTQQLNRMLQGKKESHRGFCGKRLAGFKNKENLCLGEGHRIRVDDILVLPVTRLDDARLLGKDLGASGLDVDAVRIRIWLELARPLPGPAAYRTHRWTMGEPLPVALGHILRDAGVTPEEAARIIGCSGSVIRRHLRLSTDEPLSYSYWHTLLSRLRRPLVPDREEDPEPGLEEGPAS